MNKHNIYIPSHMFLGEGDGILGYHGLPCGRVSGYKYGITHLKMIYSLFLESVKLERVLFMIVRSSESGGVEGGGTG